MKKASEKGMTAEGKEATVGYKTERPYPNPERTTRKTDPRYRRKALIVGINNYPDPDSRLNGCVNDAVDIYDTLLICGFPKTRRKLLLDEKATKANILNGLDDLIEGSEKGDVLVFYYSGHGSQVPDMDAEEPDQLDEVLIPWDYDFDNGVYITDDELHAIFSKLPDGVRMDVILDCCFSGTATRSLSRVGLGEKIESLTSGRKQRYLTPPRNMLGRINTSIPSRTKLIRAGISVIVRQMNSLWAACQDYQVAWELDIGGQVRGAFTYTFTKILRRSNGNLGRAKIYEILRTTMSNEGYDQVPDLEAASDAALVQYPFRRPTEDEPTEIPEESGQP
jgi:hypothetical protein